MRRLAYSRPFETILGHFMQERATRTRVEQSEADRWNELLAGTFASYLDSTLSVVTRARLIGTLVRDLRHRAVSALDIGCGGGQLAEALFERGFERYVGIDVSRVAIEAAQSRMNIDRSRFPAECRFEAGELGKYTPGQIGPENGFDLVVLSEVLYYAPTPGDAVGELNKCATWLNSEGLISISLKDDGKSHAEAAPFV